MLRKACVRPSLPLSLVKSMIRYLVVDCDDPAPNFEGGIRGAIERTVDRVARKLNEYLASVETTDGTNIVVGVTRGDVSSSERGVVLATERINHMKHQRVFKNVAILNSETCTIEAGLNSPPDIAGELHILSNRIATRCLFTDDDCWWNIFSDLKRSVKKIGKKRRRRRHVRVHGTRREVF